MTAVPAPDRATKATGVLPPGAGTAIPRGTHWTNYAACTRLDPDFFFDTALAAEALHICRTHCPVLRQCQQLALRLHPRPYECVMGGLAWPARYDRPRPGPALAAPSCRLCPRSTP